MAALLAYAAPEVADRITLAVSELVTNAVVHTGRDLTVRARCDHGRVVVQVTDAIASPPRRSEAADLAEAGRGLHLVDVVADEWGRSAHERGKTVWATFDCASLSS